MLATCRTTRHMLRVLERHAKSCNILGLMSSKSRVGSASAHKQHTLNASVPCLHDSCKPHNPSASVFARTICLLTIAAMARHTINASIHSDSGWDFDGHLDHSIIIAHLPLNSGTAPIPKVNNWTNPMAIKPSTSAVNCVYPI